METAFLLQEAFQYRFTFVDQVGIAGAGANAVGPLHGKQIPQTLLDKYASEEWRLGTKIPFTKDIEHRFEWGGVEIQLEMKGEYIRDCRIYSDALETEVFDVIEEHIKGCRYDAGDITGLSSGLPDGTSATAYEILGLIAKSI